MDHLRVLDIVQVLCFQQARFQQHRLDRFVAVLGPADVLRLLVFLVPVLGDLLHDLVERDIQLGLVVGGAGDDERSAGFVDQDAVDFIDHGEVEGALHHLAALVLHIVAQVVEPEFVIGAVGNVAGVGFAPLRFGQIRYDDADGQTEEGVKLPHPFRIAAGKVVIDRHDVDALALDGIEIGGQRRHQRLALARPHLGDLAAMQYDAADHLHIEMPHPQHAHRCLAHGGEGFGQDVVDLLAIGQAGAELVGLRGQVCVGQRLHIGFERVDLVDDLAERLDVTVVAGAEQGLGEGFDHGEAFAEDLEHFDRVLCRGFAHAAQG